MSYNLIKDITVVNKTVCSSRQIKYIVIHYTGNITDTARANANYFKAVNRGASAHYFIDDNYCYQVVEDKDVAWAVGRNYGSNNMFGKVTNNNSISIEMCSTNGSISDATFNNTVTLTKLIMNKYNIAASNVVRHYDVCSKKCPGWNGWSTGNGNSDLWNKFKSLLLEKSATISSVSNVTTTSSNKNYPYYRGHVQGIGWDSVKSAGEIAGTTGKGLRMEAIKIDYPEASISAKAHIQSIGDIDYGVINSSTVIGTTGKGLRMEAIYLKGPIQARVHIQSMGWMEWQNMTTGKWLGTKGKSLRLEAIQIKRL